MILGVSLCLPIALWIWFFLSFRGGKGKWFLTWGMWLVCERWLMEWKGHGEWSPREHQQLGGSRRRIARKRAEEGRSQMRSIFQGGDQWGESKRMRSLEIMASTISIGCCGQKVCSLELKCELEESQAEWCLKHVNHFAGKPEPCRIWKWFPRVLPCTFLGICSQEWEHLEVQNQLSLRTQPGTQNS